MAKYPLWYNVWFSKDTSATRAAAEVAFLDGNEMAVPVPKIVSRARPETVWDMYGVRVDVTAEEEGPMQGLKIESKTHKYSADYHIAKEEGQHTSAAM